MIYNTDAECPVSYYRLPVKVDRFPWYCRVRNEVQRYAYNDKKSNEGIKDCRLELPAIPFFVTLYPNHPTTDMIATAYNVYAIVCPQRTIIESTINPSLKKCCMIFYRMRKILQKIQNL